MNVTMENLLLRPAEAAEVLSISRSKVYELIAAGVLPYVRVGGSVRLPAQQLRVWIEKQIITDGVEPNDPPAFGRLQRLR